MAFLGEQPVAQPVRLRQPAAGREGMALRQRGAFQQRRRQQRPGQVADLRLAQFAEEIIEKSLKMGHLCSLAL
ncbi:hypothetical protein D3C76_1316740 [compost metagenome]